MRRTHISPLLYWSVLALLFTLLFLTSAAPAHASNSPWSWQNPLPQGSDLDGVWGSGPNDVFAVGANGTILHYNGAAWQPMNSPIVAHLRGVWGSGPADVFVVGDGGAILHYDGVAWLPMSSGISSTLWDVWGSGPTDVFAVGENGVILHYTGAGWLPMLSFVTLPLYGIWGSGSADVYAVGTGGVVHYDGLTWNKVNTGTAFALVDVWGASSSDVYAVDGDWETKVLHYNGSAWTTLQVPSYPAGGLWVAGASEFFIVGYEGAIIHCDGACSNSVPSGTNQGLDAVWGSSSQDVFAVGRGGIILHYDGMGWSRMTTGVTAALTDIWGIGANAEYAVGYDGVILHYNGAAWESMASGTTAGLLGVWGSASNDVFAVGYEGTILHYNGAAWQPMASGTTAGLSGVWGSASNDVFAIGSGVILHFDGTAWMGMDSGGSYYLTSIWGSTGTDVYAAGGLGADGVVLHYDGTKWAIDLQVSGMFAPATMVDIWGVNSGLVFAAAYNGTALQRTNGQWTGYALANFPQTYIPTGIWGSSGSDIYVTGSAGAAFGPSADSGPILHYDGSSWSSVVGVPAAPTKLWGNSAGELFAAGYGGMILRYSPTPGQKAVEVNIVGTGGGRISSTPAGFDCTGWCVKQLATGVAVTLQAKADPTSDFTGWSGPCDGVGDCILTIDGDKRVRAGFTRHTFALNVVKIGTGSGSVAGALAGASGSIDCGSSCSATFAAGDALYLVAAPTVDSRFDGWSGACSGTGVCAVLVDSDETVTATFRFVGEMDIVAHHPLTHEVGANLAAPIHVVFGEAVDANTANSATLAVYGSFSGLRSGGTAILGSAVDLQPVRPFFTGERVAVVATSGIRSTSDKTVRPDQWGFTAGPVTNRCVAGYVLDPTSAFVAAAGGSVAWGDYDGDGDLDLLAARPSTYTAGMGSTHIYRNEGGPSPVFTELPVDLSAVTTGVAAWVDYNGDGSLDIAAAGSGPSEGSMLHLYHNNGGPIPTFTDNLILAPGGYRYQNLAWGDYDNDGDQDVVTAGHILRNDGGASPKFVDINAGLASMSDDLAAWADYDNDGDLDLLIAGSGGTRIYRNSGSGAPTFTAVDPGIGGLLYGSADWGDYDRDGDLDLLLMGFSYGPPARTTRIYRNSGAPEYSFAGTPLDIADTNYGSAAWGDYDNDGYLDVLLAGSPSDPMANQPSNILLQIFRNKGDGSFEDMSQTSSSPLRTSVAAWGDYDTDGVLDVLLTGWTSDDISFSHLYRSDDCPSLTIHKNGSGTGTITSSPSGVNCGEECRVTFAPGTLVTLNPAAAPDSSFARWGGACTGSGQCQVTLDTSKAVTATFDLQTTKLNVNKTGLGAGVVTSGPPGISCGSVCDAEFPRGTSITLIATPDPGSTFEGWSGSCTGGGACTFDLTATANVVANFGVAGALLPEGVTIYYGKQLAVRNVPASVVVAAETKQTNLVVFKGAAPSSVFLVGVEGSEPYVDQTTLQRLINRFLATGCNGGPCNAVNCVYYESDGSRQDVVQMSWTPTDFVYMPLTRR